jgi:hydrogenase maturation protease
MTVRRILVAGIGNIFLGDDAFGVEVVHQLAGRSLPEGVCVADFGIRGFDLACALLDGYDSAVLVDAVRRGGPPGTLYVLAIDHVQADDALVEMHRLDPRAVFGLVKAMGGRLPRLRLVGCEALICAEEDGYMGLSGPVQAAVPDAVALIETLVAELLAQGDA